MITQNQKVCFKKKKKSISQMLDIKKKLLNISIRIIIILIGDAAFKSCYHITGDLIIPEGITSIGYESFYDCINLNRIVKLPDTLTYRFKSIYGL